MFSVVRAVLLSPLEYHDPDRIVCLSIENIRRNEQDLSRMAHCKESLALPSTLLSTSFSVRNSDGARPIWQEPKDSATLAASDGNLTAARLSGQTKPSAGIRDQLLLIAEPAFSLR